MDSLFDPLSGREPATTSLENAPAAILPLSWRRHENFRDFDVLSTYSIK
jgi:hypothetical protein